MRKQTIAVAIFIAGLSTISAWAQEDTTRARTFRRSTDAGKEVRIFTYTQHRSDCSPVAEPRVTIASQPAHGTAMVRPDSVKSGPPRFGATDCSGQVYAGSGIFYRPEPSFHGSDRFEYQVLFDNGIAHDTAIVEVK